jgi:hypothetical protein
MTNNITTFYKTIYYLLLKMIVTGTQTIKQLKSDYTFNEQDGQFYQKVPVYITKQIQDIPIKVDVSEAVGK